MFIQLPDDVQYIINTLTEYGYEAFAVGGCVRDSILNRTPGDWDITTSALPWQVKELFARTIDTGIEHGTVTIMIKDNGYEVTTYRIDGEYADSRHPNSVEYTASLKEDLMRRDFTINAMAYNDERGLVDCFDGIGDIDRRLIRCVGEADKRFTEDALRMLRAVRFSAQLGFSIHEDTRVAIRKLAPTIEKISKERIHTELAKTLLSNNPDYIFDAMSLGITKYSFDVIDAHGDVGCARVLLKALPKELFYRYAAFMYELDYKAAERQLRKLKLDNDTISKVCCLVKFHGIDLGNEFETVRRNASMIGREMFPAVLRFEREYYCAHGDMERADDVRRAENMYEQICTRGECLSIAELAINGNDLIKAGIEPGKRLGELLNKALDIVLSDPSLNEYDVLMKTVLINN